MTKKVNLFLFLVITVLLICPVKTSALEINKTVDTITENIYVLNDTNIDLGEYNQEQNCDGGNSILGDPNDENSVAWLLQHILDFIKIMGPVLVVVLSSIDFAKVIVKSDDEAMAKAQKKLGIRLILAILLFLIPVLVEAILDIFAFSSGGTCGLH